MFYKERSNDVILVLAEFFRIGRVFPVLADFFPYWPSLFRIGRVYHQYDASRFCDTNAIFMRLINNQMYNTITACIPILFEHTEMVTVTENEGHVLYFIDC